MAATETSAVATESGGGLSQPTVRARGAGRWQNRWVGAVTSHLLLWVVGFLFAFPFAWLVTSSFKTPVQIFVFPPEWWPNPINWQNYPLAFAEMNFARY